MFLFAGVLGGVLGCVGPIARDAARAAAPAAIEGAVEGVADPKNQQKLADGIDEEAVEKIAERLSGKIVDGTMQSLSDPGRRKLVAETFRDVRVPIGLEGGMDLRVAKINPEAVAGAVDAALGKVIARVDQKQVKTLVAGIVDEAVRTAFSSARSELRKSDVPTETQVASLTRSLSKEATLGFQDAIDQARRERDAGQKQEGEGSVLWAVSRAAESGKTLLDVWKIALVGLALALVAGFVWAVRQHRTHRRELLQRDEALALLSKRIDGDAATADRNGDVRARTEVPVLGSRARPSQGSHADGEPAAT